MISAARWAREKKVPYLGICLGFQIAVIEYVRNVLGIETAGSAELDADCKDPVIIYMPEISKTHLGGTMRLGLRPSIFQKGTEEWSKIHQLYGGQPVVWERHRHRYEVNPEYVERIESAASNPSLAAKAAPQKVPATSPPLPSFTSPRLGYPSAAEAEPAGIDELKFVGRDEKGERMQIAELRNHPYFVGMQAHPEFCSRPLNPSPPFLGFIAASAGLLDEQLDVQKNYVPPHPKSHMISESEMVKRRDAGETDDKPATTPPGAATPTRSLSLNKGTSKPDLAVAARIAAAEKANSAATDA
jgi:CTP synthase